MTNIFVGVAPKNHSSNQEGSSAGCSVVLARCGYWPRYWRPWIGGGQLKANRPLTERCFYPRARVMAVNCCLYYLKAGRLGQDAGRPGTLLIHKGRKCYPCAGRADAAGGPMGLLPAAAASGARHGDSRPPICRCAVRGALAAAASLPPVGLCVNINGANSQQLGVQR